jgi:hypothetical protein
LLEEALRRYQNRAIETAKVIEELIQLAKDIRKAVKRVTVPLAASSPAAMEHA